jgi:NACalpha-BTF3-like transcription factor
MGAKSPGKPSAEEGVTKQEALPVLVRLVSPERRTLEEILPVTARVTALLEEEVTARLTGVRITRFLADVGDLLEPGATVAMLDADDLEHRLLEAQASLREAESRKKETQWAVKDLQEQQKTQLRTIERKHQVLERLQKEGRSVAQDEVDAARYEWERETSTLESLSIQEQRAIVVSEQAEVQREKAALALKKAEHDLGYASVRALNGGIVIERQGTIGQSTGNATALFRIYEPKSVVLSSRIPQGRLKDVRVGQTAEFMNDAYPGILFVTELVLVEPKVDSEAGVVGLRLRLDVERTQKDQRNAEFLSTDRGQAALEELKSGRLLRPGMYFSGRVVLRRAEATLVVPRKAVDFHLGQPSLFLIESGTGEQETADNPIVLRLPFREGLGEEGYVQVLPLRGGRTLLETDRIVLVGQDRLKNGDRVRVAKDPVGPPDEGPEGS